MRAQFVLTALTLSTASFAWISRKSVAEFAFSYFAAMGGPTYLPNRTWRSLCGRLKIQ